MSEPARAPAKTKKKTERATTVGLAEKASILALHASGISGHKIAALTKRHRETIRKILSGPEAEHARELARSALLENAESLAGDWLKASAVAAKRGDHRPALDALERLRVVDAPTRTPQGSGFTVSVGIMLPGLGPTAQQPTFAVPAGADVIDVTDAE